MKWSFIMSVTELGVVHGKARSEALGSVLGPAQVLPSGDVAYVLSERTGSSWWGRVRDRDEGSTTATSSLFGAEYR